MRPLVVVHLDWRHFRFAAWWTKQFGVDKWKLYFIWMVKALKKFYDSYFIIANFRLLNFRKCIAEKTCWEFGLKSEMASSSASENHSRSGPCWRLPWYVPEFFRTKTFGLLIGNCFEANPKVFPTVWTKAVDWQIDTIDQSSVFVFMSPVRQHAGRHSIIAHSTVFNTLGYNTTESIRILVANLNGYRLQSCNL